MAAISWFDNNQLAAHAGQLIAALRTRQHQVALAESCTGGLIAKLLTDQPGSSDVFGFGFVTYANAAKASMLGVSTAVLASKGAVSREVVEQMVDGAAAQAATQAAIAVSGIAGPGGGTLRKPVGTVWVAARWSNARVVRCHHFVGTRDAIRRATAGVALGQLLAIRPQ